MNVLVTKVGVKDGQERFILADASTGDSIVKRDVSERTLRDYLKTLGGTDHVVDEAFLKARKRFSKGEGPCHEVVDEIEDIYTEIVLEEEGNIS